MNIELGSATSNKFLMWGGYDWDMYLKRPAHRASIIVTICVCMLGGAWLGVNDWVVAGGLGVGWGFVAILLWRTWYWWMALSILALIFGISRGHTYEVQLHNLTNLSGSAVTIEGTVATDPVTSANSTTQVRLNHLRLNGRDQRGMVLVRGRNLRLERGYRIRVAGQLEPGFATWDAELSFPKLIVLSDHLPPLEQLRQHFFTGLRSAVPEPEASFGLGLLVGVGALIPKELQQQLTRVGLSHLTTVSGYNLTIIVRLVTRALARFGPNAATLLSLWLIGAFVVLAGASASIVRAGAVSCLSLVAARHGFRIAPTVLITVTAVATVIYNPAYFRDVGWALSFLAFFGILVVAPAVMACYGEPRWAIGRMVIETLGAEVMVLPLIAVVFGQMSVVGVGANLVVEPFVPLAMALAAMTGAAGMWLPVIAPLIGAVTTGAIGAILRFITELAALPWAMVSFKVSLLQGGMCYCLFGIFIIVLHLHTRRRARFAILDSDRSSTCLDIQSGPP